MGSRAYQGLSAGVFLIGLGVLLLARISIWPWILVVVGLSSLPASLAVKKGWYGWQGSLWLIGLAILFATNQLFPGILILVGISALGSAITRDAEGSPFAGNAGPTLPQPTPARSGATQPLTVADAEPDAEPAEKPEEPTPPSAGAAT